MDRTTKKYLDRIVALVLLVLLAPLFLLVGMAVWGRYGKPLLFKQQRAGLKGRPFYLWKFRTMLDLRDQQGVLLPDRDRITTLGRVLRSTSLDELPGIWNVVTGEMSLVGPRPLPIDYLPLYSKEQARRHDVKPGITGWAQVNGRNAISWEEKFKLDIWYVDNQSLWIDLKILAKTALVVISRSGVSPPDDFTMTRFAGSFPVRKDE